jgi:hypothetical protein
MKNILQIKRRQAQRMKIARAMKDLRKAKPSKNREEAFFCLGLLASNYPKLKREGK